MPVASQAVPGAECPPEKDGPGEPVWEAPGTIAAPHAAVSSLEPPAARVPTPGEESHEAPRLCEV